MFVQMYVKNNSTQVAQPHCANIGAIQKIRWPRIVSIRWPNSKCEYFAIFAHQQKYLLAQQKTPLLTQAKILVLAQLYQITSFIQKIISMLDQPQNTFIYWSISKHSCWPSNRFKCWSNNGCSYCRKQNYHITQSK